MFQETSILCVNYHKINNGLYPDEANWAADRCDSQLVNGFVCQTTEKDDFCARDDLSGPGSGNEDSTTDMIDPDSAPGESICLGIEFPI